MIKRLAALLLFLNVSFAYAQTIKTDVLVIGGTSGGMAAAVQCARSNVKTIQVLGGPALSSNIGREFFVGIIPHSAQKTGDATSPDSATKSKEATHKIDTFKNLTIDSNATFISIKKDDDRWEVVISRDGKAETIKPRVVIDATKDGIVVKKAGLTYSPFDILENTSQLKTYRTSIATGNNVSIKFDTLTPVNNYPPFPAYIIPIKTLIVKGADNLLFIGNLIPFDNELAAQLAIGQGAGVTAAYCAFFKTTTSNLNIRAIQVELLDFKGYLLPFEDISTDPYWRAIQQICATGMLKGVQKTNGGEAKFLFMPDSIVTTAEVKPVLTEIYTRAFLWFSVAKPGKQFTVGNLLSFISELTLTDPENLQRKIQKEWTTQYKFKSAFDMERPITRREFAILANKYLNPFARTVNLNGRVVN